MGSMVSGLAGAVLGVAEGVGLSGDTVARYGKCCEVVVEFCDRPGLDALSVSVVDEFVACQQIGHHSIDYVGIGRGQSQWCEERLSIVLMQLSQPGRVAKRVAAVQGDRRRTMRGKEVLYGLVQ